MPAQLVGVDAGDVIEAEFRERLSVIRTGTGTGTGIELRISRLTLFTQAQAAVVQAGQLQAAGVHGAASAPARQGVFGLGFEQRGTGLDGLGVAHARLGTGLEGVVVVSDHQGVRAQAGVCGIARVFHPAEQAFFQKQALHEGQVGFLVLNAQRALGIDACIGQIPTPRGHELALGLIVGKDCFDDLNDGLTLEDVGVGAVRLCIVSNSGKAGWPIRD
jgi:hypothetical protein